VQLLGNGKSTKEVAVALGLATETAETQRANRMRRLDCHSMTERIHSAVRNETNEA
jgi:DNA-binding NarL/FixJ family response regulator